MPKHEPMTAKAIGKRIKSKGLQKLKFYCQMCQKQCRDENGFKCHMTSEAHQRQLLLFAENPHKYMDEFSGEFMKDFVHLLKRRYCSKRVFANQVYQEYIKDRNHLHMNSTRWVTLSGFVKWMGRKGICHVDNTEKGWFITYIDRDPETLARQENLAKKEKMSKDDEERQAKVIDDMIKRGKLLEEQKNGGGSGEGGESLDRTEHSDDGETERNDIEKMMLKKENDEQKIVFSFASKKPMDKTSLGSRLDNKTIKKEENEEIEQEVDINSIIQPIPDIKPLPNYKFNVFKKEPEEDSKHSIKRKSTDHHHSEHRPTSTTKSGQTKRTKSALDEIIEEQERWKARKQAKQQNSDTRSGSGSSQSKSWLVPQIVVRVVAKELGTEYYNQKAVVLKTVDEFGAVIKMCHSGDMAKVDEQHLETVIPKVGSRVMVLRGLYREHRATITDIDMKRERIYAKVDNSSNGGKSTEFKFDDVSKLADD